MKKNFIIVIFLLSCFVLKAQIVSMYDYDKFSQKRFDSLQQAFKTASNDTVRMDLSRELGLCYIEGRADSAVYFHELQLSIARKLNIKLWQADALDNLGYALKRMGKYPQGLTYLIEGIKIAGNPETQKNIFRVAKFSQKSDPRIARLTVLGNLNHDLGNLYNSALNIDKKFYYYKEAKKIAESIGDESLLSMVCMNIGNTYLEMNEPDSALAYELKALKYSDNSGFRMYYGLTLIYLGNIYATKGKFDASKKYYKESIQVNKELNNLAYLAEAHIALANLFKKTEQIDSCLYYAKIGLSLFKKNGEPQGSLTAAKLISSVYRESKNVDSAFAYQSMTLLLADSLNLTEKIKQLENIGFSEQLYAQQLAEQEAAYQNRIRIYAMLTFSAVLLLIGIFLYRNIRQKQKVNDLLYQQNVEIENTLSQLKSTQSQLIQSEKMASLGELTAGIAHEIQNPLNFVNNFSEVNTELIEELEQEAGKGNLPEVKLIAKDIKENEQKINHHGKRADAIVKGMLQHSQSGGGIKEPTDINALADDYLRLAYHGFQAKDKSFNTTLNTDYDGSIGSIIIIPQDIGRVLLNLYNNAFYALSAKKKTVADVGYEATLWLQTKKAGDKVEISVRDNGNGVPVKIKEKIFQPFFTTKPTGQGTGLGLSLSYDIVKAHGGELKVETREGEGSIFIVQLPSV
jgi:two-component system, NtrC family, sensor kinase